MPSLTATAEFDLPVHIVYRFVKAVNTPGESTRSVLLDIAGRIPSTDLVEHVENQRLHYVTDSLAHTYEFEALREDRTRLKIDCRWGWFTAFFGHGSMMAKLVVISTISSVEALETEEVIGAKGAA